MKNNTDNLLPATGYYNNLMRQIDDAYWIGDTDEAAFLCEEAKHIKEEYVDKGAAWYPQF